MAFKVLLNSGILCLAALLAALRCAAQESSGVSVAPSQKGPIGAHVAGLALSLTPQRVTVRLGDPLWVTAELRNVSNESQPLHYEPFADYRFTIVDKKTVRIVPMDPRIDAILLTPPSISELPRKSSTYVRFRLDSFYDFSTPGQYSAIVNSGVAIVNSSVQSNPIAITMLAKRPGSRAPARTAAPTPTFQLRLQTDRPAYVLGQPIYLRLFVRNVTDEEHNILPALIILDGQANPLGPLHGRMGDLVSSARGYGLFPPTRRMSEFFGFMDERADLRFWSYDLDARGRYTLAAFGRDTTSDASDPVHIRVLTKAEAERVPESALNDPKLDRAIMAPLEQYHVLLAETAAAIARIPRAAHVSDVYYSFGPAWGEERLNELPGTGDPASPYVNVTANFMESIRHLSRVGGAAIAPPAGAFDEPERPNSPYAHLVDRLGLGGSNLMPTAPPRRLPPATCDVVKATGELNVAEYYYDAVKSEIERGRASLGDTIHPPAVSSAPRKCAW